MTTTHSIALYQLGARSLKTYLFALLFIVGNILLPQLCHLVPQGGLILLPIYFFTLVGAYKYGFTVGLLTAVLSPLVNNLLFGMPAAPMLLTIMIKGTLLAGVAAFVASRTKKVSLLGLIAVVLLAQCLGMLWEWAYTSSLSAALQDFRLGWPGLLLQIFGGFLLLSYVLKK